MEPEKPPVGTLAERPDAQLVCSVGEGDEEALWELYRRYSTMLLGLARRILGNTADAEEVLQEVFLQLWKQADRYRERRSSVSTWLGLITRSRSIDRLRSRKVVERTADRAGHESATHTSPEGGSNVLQNQRRELLSEALGCLPPEQREVVELAYFAG